MHKELVWKKIDPLREAGIDVEDEEFIQDLNDSDISILDKIKLEPNNKFNFWVGFTNFKISQSDAETLDNIDGVESLHIISPYRFVVSFGELFDEENVKNIITELLCGKEILDDVVQLKLEIVQEVVKNYDDHVIYIAPNGNITYTFLNDGKNNEEYNKQKILIEDTKNKHGGLIICKQ